MQVFHCQCIVVVCTPAATHPSAVVWITLAFLLFVSSDAKKESFTNCTNLKAKRQLTAINMLGYVIISAHWKAG